MSSLSSISFFLSEELIIWRAGFTISFDTAKKVVTKLYIAHKNDIKMAFHHKQEIIFTTNLLTNLRGNTKLLCVNQQMSRDCLHSFSGKLQSNLWYSTRMDSLLISHEQLNGPTCRKHTDGGTAPLFTPHTATNIRARLRHLHLYRGNHLRKRDLHF